MKVVTRYYNWKIKYPDIFNGNQVSLQKCGYYLNMYNNLKKARDIDSLELLGLQDFGEDIKYILEPGRLKRIRREKLDKINGKNT